MPFETDPPRPLFQAAPASPCRQAILTLTPHVELVHHLPGRARLRPQAGLEALAAARRHAGEALEAFRALLPGLRQVRVNAVSGSVLVEYDPAQLPFAWVDAFLRTRCPDRAARMLDELIPQP